ncbi:hypothetical protein O3G_MSEX010300 [Manduca sexta]|uniref:Uncharacterized protein n=1 Tax=Manduca sexta TaxID=7130 RepID=A0A921ZG90_MANSE|nr:hypothetical protein O3G_MSEX010300 [Manduca sexta]KAG6457423.1 hypothetical protein O3G_MSEX010300 [Manduca sexta]
MVSEMKFIISENEKVIHTITKETNSQTLVKTLEEFQHAVNTKLTKMIEELGGTVGDEDMESESEDCDDDENEDISILPKKRRK